MGRARAREVMLSAEDYEAELAERYRWINRALPGAALGEFVRSLAHRIAGFPADGRAVLKNRISVISLAQIEDFRRDSDLFLERARRRDAAPDARGDVAWVSDSRWRDGVGKYAGQPG
jgi:enoyl-CoA hydratase/carnithine racemase